MGGELGGARPRQTVGAIQLQLETQTLPHNFYSHDASMHSFIILLEPLGTHLSQWLPNELPRDPLNQ